MPARRPTTFGPRCARQDGAPGGDVPRQSGPLCHRPVTASLPAGRTAPAKPAERVLFTPPREGPMKNTKFGMAPWVAVSGMFHLAILLAATAIGFRLEEPTVCPFGPCLIKLPDSGRAKLPAFPSGPIRSDVERQSLPPSNADERALEPHIYDPSAELSDHPQSDDDEDFQQRKGQGYTFLGYEIGRADGIRGRGTSSEAGLIDTLGTGGGAGGSRRFGGDKSGRKNLVGIGGGNSGTEAAVLAGLRWLARHQHPDGRWSTGHFSDSCGGGSRCGGPGSRDHDVGLTGLVLLAFLGAGYLPSNRHSFEDPFRKDPSDPTRPRTIRFGEVVRDGLRW